MDRCLEQVVASSTFNCHNFQLTSSNCTFGNYENDERDTSLASRHPSSSSSSSPSPASSTAIFDDMFSSIANIQLSSDPLADLFLQTFKYRKSGSSEILLNSTRDQQLPSILAGWTDKYFQKVMALLHRDSNKKLSDFLKRFLGILLIHQQLKQSGFYYTTAEGADKVEMRALGEKLQPGSFFLRNSSDSRCLFSISFRTMRGSVKSTRIIYEGGEYFFDCSTEHAWKAKRFPTPIHLIQHYRTHRNNSTSFRHHDNGEPQSDGNRSSKRASFTSVTGGLHSYEQGVVLSNPLKIKPDTLRHLARLAVNQSLGGRSVDELPLSFSLKEFLLQYIFTF